MRFGSRIVVALAVVAVFQGAAIAQYAWTPDAEASRVFAPTPRPGMGPATAEPSPSPVRPEPQTFSPPEPPPPIPARLNPDPQHRFGDLIEISIDRQRATAWRDGRVVYRFLVSTGVPGLDTPLGRFHLRAKYKLAWSHKYKAWMPYAMQIYGGYFMHELPYTSSPRFRSGAGHLGHRASHGCVRLGIGDAKKLYDWAEVNTPIWIH